MNSQSKNHNLRKKESLSSYSNRKEVRHFRHDKDR